MQTVARSASARILCGMMILRLAPSRITKAMLTRRLTYEMFAGSGSQLNGCALPLILAHECRKFCASPCHDVTSILPWDALSPEKCLSHGRWTVRMNLTPHVDQHCGFATGQSSSRQSRRRSIVMTSRRQGLCSAGTFSSLGPPSAS